MVKIGDRVVVEGSIQDTAVVRFVGLTKFSGGTWVGVELDHKPGRNNGSIDGIEYFSMVGRSDKVNYGLFTRVDNIRPLTKINGNKDIDRNSPETPGIIPELKNKIESLTSKYSSLKGTFVSATESYNTTIEELQQTIDNLTLAELDLTSQLNETSKKFQIVVDENITLKESLTRLKENRNLDNDTHSSLLLNQNGEEYDTESLARENKLLRMKVQNLENSSNEILKQYEDCLNSNTDTLKTNIELEDNIKKLMEESKYDKNLIQELSLKVEATDNSDNIIDYLTETNNKMTREIEDLKGELSIYGNKNKDFLEEQSSWNEAETYLQKQIEDLKSDLNNKTTLLETEYEKNISLTRELEKIQNSVYVTQSYEIDGLKQSLDNSQKIIETSKCYKQFADSYLNSKEKSLNISYIQLQILTTIAKSTQKLNQGGVPMAPVLFYFQLIESTLTFFQDGQYFSSTDLILPFITDLCTVSIWKNQIMNNNINIKDYNINTFLKFISKDETLNSNLYYITRLLIDLLENIFLNILEDLKSTADDENISETYASILECLEISNRLQQMITPKSMIIKYDDNKNKDQFVQLLRHLHDIFVDSTDYNNIHRCMELIKQYLFIVRNLMGNNINIKIENTTDTGTLLPQIRILKNSTADSSANSRNNISNLEQDLISELKLKIKVLNTKVEESKFKDDANIRLKDNIKSLTTKLSDENNKVRSFDEKMNKMKYKLDELNLESVQLIKDKTLTGTLMSKTDIEKMDLISQLDHLKSDIIDKIIDDESEVESSNTLLNWLKQDKLASETQRTPIKKTSNSYYRKSEILMRNLNILVDKLPTADSFQIQQQDMIIKNIIDDLVYSDM